MSVILESEEAFDLRIVSAYRAIFGGGYISTVPNATPRKHFVYTADDFLIILSIVSWHNLLKHVRLADLRYIWKTTFPARVAVLKGRSTNC